MDHGLTSMTWDRGGVAFTGRWCAARSSPSVDHVGVDAVLEPGVLRAHLASRWDSPSRTVGGHVITTRQEGDIESRARASFMIHGWGSAGRSDMVEQ